MSLEEDLRRRDDEQIYARDLRLAVTAWSRQTDLIVKNLQMEIDALREAYQKVSQENVLLRRLVMRRPVAARKAASQ